MNELIERIFDGFEINKIPIPVRYLFYEGHGEPYVTYQQQDADRTFSGDDRLLGYVDYYDFDVYSKGNFTAIIERIKELLTENDFVWEPSRTSGDLYDSETGYYHKTLNFAYMREV